MNKLLAALGVSTVLGVSAFAQTVITTDITTNTTWTTAGNPYILDKLIYVKNGATLDIAPGVIIRGQPQGVVTSVPDAGSLAITVGSKIQARGSASAPIIFTTAAIDATNDDIADTNSNGTFVRWTPADGLTKFWDDQAPIGGAMAPVDSNGRKNMAMWGGLVVMGDSFTNNGRQVDINGDTVLDALDDGVGYAEGVETIDTIYGGSDALDSSGLIQYISIRHGGIGVVANKEINGLTLYSVGSGTTIRYVDIYSTSDDGVEIFGGTVNLSNLNITFADDDGLDIDEGYQGMCQFVFVYQGYNYGDNGMELDGDDYNNDDGNQGPLGEYFPVTNAKILNSTVIYRKAAAGIRMRANFAGLLANGIVRGSGSGVGIRTDGSAGPEPVTLNARQRFADGQLQIRNMTVNGFTTQYTAFTGTGLAGTGIGLNATGGFVGTLSLPSYIYPATNNRGGAPFIENFVDNTEPTINPRPANATAYGTALGLDYIPSPGVSTSYRGAFAPGSGTLWTFGWTAMNRSGELAN